MQLESVELERSRTGEGVRASKATAPTNSTLPQRHLRGQSLGEEKRFEKKKGIMFSASAAQAYANKLDWVKLLNEVMGVYVAGGFADFAMDMLPQYAVFGVEPDVETWEHLLRMPLGTMRSPCFGSLWSKDYVSS